MTDIPLPTRCCSNCRFWQAVSMMSQDEVAGECRRRNPMPEIGKAPAKDYRRGYWPVTRPIDWCGEFRHLPGPASEPKAKPAAVKTERLKLKAKP